MKILRVSVYSGGVIFIVDWIFVADEEKVPAENSNKEEEKIHESGFKEFLHEAKSDLKVFGKEVKSIFGKASAFGKKAFSSKKKEP
jgi:hypothetical protein